MVIYRVAVWNLKAGIHQEFAAEHLALVWQGNVVDAVQFMDTVEFVRVESRHSYAREMLVAECLQFPPVEHGLVLFRRTIHHRSHVKTVIWRHEPVDVTQLHHGTYFLIFTDGIATMLNFIRSHVLWLNFHAETAAHGHVNAEFDRNSPECLVIGSRAYVRGHRYSREEIGCSPLHVNPLQGIRIVTDPKLIKPRHYAIIGPSATACAGLNCNIRIFSTDTVTHFSEAAVIFDIHMALPVFRKILRAMVHYRHIGVPLDIVYLRIFRHDVIHNLEHEILYGRIAQIKHYLCTSTPEDRLTLRGLNDPVGMFFIKFADGIGHLRLYPDAEFDAMLLGALNKPGNTGRKLLRVHLPVSECTIVRYARILHAEPSVVHDEQFTAH